MYKNLTVKTNNCLLFTRKASKNTRYQHLLNQPSPQIPSHLNRQQRVNIVFFIKLISPQSFLFSAHKKNIELEAKQNQKMKIISCIAVKAWRRVFSTVAQRKCEAVTIFNMFMNKNIFSDLVYYGQCGFGQPYKSRPENVTACGHAGCTVCDSVCYVVVLHLTHT